MKSNSFALFGTNKLGLFVMFFLALIISVSSVLAAAPTTPTTLSPANNSAYFNAIPLVCSGSTDADGDPINYTFYHYRYMVNESAGGSWTYTGDCGANCDYQQGDSYSNMSSLIVDDQVTLTVYKNVKFLTDEFRIQIQNVRGQEATTTIQINNTILQTWTTDSGNLNITYDVSKYNDGNSYSIKIEIGQLSNGPSDRVNWWWEANQTDILQDSTLTTYSWDVSQGIKRWLCQACDNNSDCSTNTELMTVNRLNLSSCSSGNIALNFTLFDEEDRTDNIEGDWSFNLNLNADDSYSYSSNIEDKYNVTLCLNPSGIPVTVSGMLQYKPTNATKYTYPREYYLNRATITGGSQTDINVYSLEDALATVCQFRVTTDGVSPLAGHLIHLQRWHPGDGLFDLVAMGNTSSSGTYTIYLRQTDAFYKAFIYDGNNILQKTLDTTQIQSCPLNIVVGSGSDDTYDDVESWLNFDNIILNLRFNSTTNTTSLTWDDSTGYATQVCLRIDKFATTGMSLYNYTCLTSSSGTIYQNINESGHYIAKAIVFHNSEWRLLDSLVIEIVSTISELLSGNEGVFYAFLLILTITFVGLYSPPISIFLAIIGFIFSKMLGLITVGWGAIIGLVVTGGILIFKQKGR